MTDGSVSAKVMRQHADGGCTNHSYYFIIILTSLTTVMDNGITDSMAVSLAFDTLSFE